MPTVRDALRHFPRWLRSVATQREDSLRAGTLRLHVDRSADRYLFCTAVVCLGFGAVGGYLHSRDVYGIVIGAVAGMCGSLTLGACLLLILRDSLLRIIFPIAIVAAAFLGLAGSVFGRLFAAAAGIPDLAVNLAFLGAVDGVAIGFLAYWWAVRGSRARIVLHPLSVFLLFNLLGMKCGHGHGVAWLLCLGMANGLFGLLLAIPVLRSAGRPTPRGR
jgi:hypothetical protein